MNTFFVNALFNEEASINDLNIPTGVLGVQWESLGYQPLQSLGWHVLKNIPVHEQRVKQLHFPLGYT